MDVPTLPRENTLAFRPNLTVQEVFPLDTISFIQPVVSLKYEWFLENSPIAGFVVIRRQSYPYLSVNQQLKPTSDHFSKKLDYLVHF